MTEKNIVNKILDFTKEYKTPLIVAGVVGSYIAFRTVTGYMAENQLNDKLAEFNGMVEYSSASVDLVGLNVHIYDIELNVPGAKKPIKIDEIVINSFDEDHTLPEYADIEILGIEGDIKSTPISDANRERFGLDEVEGDFSFAYNFDKKKNILAIEELSFEVDDLGELTLNADIHKIKSLEYFFKNVSRGGLEYLSLGKGTINFEDDSLTDRLIKMNAGDKDLDAYKESFLKKGKDELAQAKKQGKNSFQIMFIKSAIEFMEDPGSFEISIDPEAPITFKQMARLKNDDFEQLNIDISVN